jgi:hypothetical protein
VLDLGVGVVLTEGDIVLGGVNVRRESSGVVKPSPYRYFGVLLGSGWRISEMGMRLEVGVVATRL